MIGDGLNPPPIGCPYPPVAEDADSGMKITSLMHLSNSDHVYHVL